MTVQASRFTPEVLLSAPRRSSGIPNGDASKILYSISEYSFGTHSKKSEVRVLDVASQETHPIISSAAAGFDWLGTDEVLVLTSGEGDVTDVRVGSVKDFEKSAYTVSTIPAPVGDLRICPLSNGDYGFAVSAKTTPDGQLYNASKAPKPHTSGRVYNSMFVRHWDHYVTENRNSIWVAKIAKKGDKFEMSGLRNALQDTNLESPIDPFPGTEHFDIHEKGLVFTAKDPELDPALHTKTNIYTILSDDFWTRKEFSNDAKSMRIEGYDGAKTSPVFAHDGKSLVFLAMRTDGYESDKNQVCYVEDLNDLSKVVVLFGTASGKGKWDRSPSRVLFGRDPSTLFLLAEEHGRGNLYVTGVGPQRPTVSGPIMIARGGSIGDVHALDNGDLFLSSSSLIDSSVWSLLKNATIERVLGLELSYAQRRPVLHTPDGLMPDDMKTKLLSSMSRNGSMFGLSRKQVDEIHWDGAANDTTVHAWVVKPSDFDAKKKYPLAYLIHGGPQGAWGDSWSTRWNPAIFAEQGFVVVCPNPTGSTGYGQAFTDAIRGQWGGLPYQDLVKGIDWISANMSYVDMTRAVALGASYGGYMINWIQGHELGRRFRALVCHDGVFSMTGQLASEELYFPFHDLKGRLWEDRESWAQWDPSRFTENWATPQLVIHSELDYRLTISEGLSAFHTLQARGVESQFLMFPDENHWVLNPENSLLWHQTVISFIKKHTAESTSTETEPTSRASS